MRLDVHPCDSLLSGQLSEAQDPLYIVFRSNEPEIKKLILSNHKHLCPKCFKFRTRNHCFCILWKVQIILFRLRDPCYRLSYLGGKWLFKAKISQTHGRPQGAQNGHLPSLDIRIKNQIFEKSWSEQLNWRNSCNDSFICRYDSHIAQEPGSQLRYYAVTSLQFTKSARLPAEASCKTFARIVLILVFIA